MEKYFSERQDGVRPPEHEAIDEVIWAGIDAYIRRYVANGSFGPASDAELFWRALRAEVPALPEAIEYGGAELPPTLAILDAIEFCWNAIGKPFRDEKTTSWARQFQIREEPSPAVKGQKEFRTVVNRIFRRNGLAYKLTTRGRIKRLVGPVLQETLAVAHFQSGNDRLDQMLESARQKFVDPDDEVRREALKELWDAWERLKTLGQGSNKKDQVNSILDETAGTASPNFRQVLEQEGSALTDIGNAFEIRHSETTQEPLAQSAHVDYLFHRLFALVQLILRRQPGNAH